jgi:GT2 family glycosyltransferase
MSDGLTHYDPAVPVSVIVVNWNGEVHLETCIASLRAQTLPNVEIVVVDNASTDGSLALLARCAVRVLRHAENLGYGGGLNAGIRVARGRYLFILNNDTELHPDCLAKLVAAADRWPNAGSFAPKILGFDDRTVIDNVGHRLYPDGLSRGRGRLEVERGQYDREDEIIVASGCAMLLRRALLADVGLFDERLFAYCEDTDLGLRAQLAGWHCRAVPSAVVYHRYSGSSGEYSPLKAFLVERNRLWVATRCLPWPLLLASPAFTLLRLAAQAYGALSGRGAAGRFTRERSRAALLGVLARALAAGLRAWPRAWRERRVIQARRRIGSSEALAWLARYGMGVRAIALHD